MIQVVIAKVMGLNELLMEQVIAVKEIAAIDSINRIFNMKLVSIDAQDHGVLGFWTFKLLSTLISREKLCEKLAKMLGFCQN